MWSLKCEITVIGSILVSLTNTEILYLTALVQRLQPCPAQARTRQQQSLHLLTLPEASHKEPSTTPSASLTQVPGPLAEYGSPQFQLLLSREFFKLTHIPHFGQCQSSPTPVVIGRASCGGVSVELVQMTGKTELGQDRTAMVRHWIHQKTTSNPRRRKFQLTPVPRCSGAWLRRVPGSGTPRDLGRGTWSDALPPSFPETSDLGNAVTRTWTSSARYTLIWKVY